MKTLKLELIVKDENEEDFKYALQEVLRQLEQGYTSGDLSNESVDMGWWEII